MVVVGVMVGGAGVTGAEPFASSFRESSGVVVTVVDSSANNFGREGVSSGLGSERGSAGAGVGGTMAIGGTGDVGDSAVGDDVTSEII